MHQRFVFRRRLLTCMVSGLALLRPPPATAQTWREIQSPHFHVLTDGSEKEGRDVAKEFEQMRSVFSTLFKNPVLDTGAPLLIVAVHEPGLQDLAPVFWNQRDKIAGQFFRGWERQFALVRLDSFGDLSQAVVFHEYTHTILHANLHWMPTWLDEGLAEFYAYTRFEGDHIYIGAPSVRLNHLKSESLIPIPQMMIANSGTFFNDKNRSDLFYGEAWAMVHYISYGKHMGNGAKLTSFVRLMEQGTPQLEAFQQTFGDPEEFQQKLSTYLTSTFAGGVMREIKGPDPNSFAVKILTRAEADYDLGSFDIGAHDLASGKTLLQTAESADPNLAGPHEELGFLAWRAGQDADARAEWQKAIAADPSSYRSDFALLMSGPPLKEQTPQQLEQTQHALEAINAKAPKFAPALVELALIEWRQGHLDSAYQTSLAAEKLEPWRAEYHLLTGHILLQNHQPAMAAAYARQVATRWPGSDHDEAVDLWNQVPPAMRGDGPALTLALPVDATVARGTILSTYCSRTTGLAVMLQPTDPSTAPLNLFATGSLENGFADTLWVGEDHYTPCFHLTGLPAVVAYKPSADGTAKLLVFEVRDDLPALILSAPAPKPADVPTPRP
jgi:hypothetical protein